MQRLNISRIIDFLAGPKLLHTTLPIVMVYLVIGTVAQKYMGLYQATKVYFYDPVIWLGFLPLPGFPILMAVLTLNLTANLIFKSPWSVRKAGIITTHIGILLLLVGGFITGMFAKEGFIDLREGESKNFVSDYHIREFAVLNSEGDAVEIFDFQALKPGDVLNLDAFGLSLHVKEICRHCQIFRREDASDIHQGLAHEVMISPIPPRKEDEENQSGVAFSIGKKEFIALEGIKTKPEIVVNGDTYHLDLRRQKRPLPFSVSLVDFEKEKHPGTDLAKEYASEIIIQDNGSEWRSYIGMNQPVRYKGYTLYQASYLETDQGPVSVLSAVWNAGRSFPYISGIVVSIGLILHLIVRTRGKMS